LYFSAFDGDQPAVIEKCNRTNVQLQVQIGCDEVSSVAAVQLAEKYPHFYTTVGLHPCDVKTCFTLKKEYRPSGYEQYKLKAHTFDALFQLFDRLIQSHRAKVVGLGETGFDLYHENSKEILDLQWDSFERHVHLAEKHSLPLVIHTRNATKELFQFLEAGKSKNRLAVIHCFSEGADVAAMVTKKYEFFLGIGGVATYPKSEAIREAIRVTPLEYLLTETDAPFLVPQEARKAGTTRNDASFIPEVVALIAQIKNMPQEKCGEILFENAHRFFGL
jgi:TatD DNase family protein